MSIVNLYWNGKPSSEIFKEYGMSSSVFYKWVRKYSVIGGAIAGSSGADFLCYVTPAEHLRLPDLQDVKDGIIATKIAAHAADIAKGIPNARDIDNKMSEARRRVDWEGMYACSIDPEKARKYRESVAGK